MAKPKIDLGGGAAENTVAMNPIIGLAREDLMGAVGVMLRETAVRPVKTLKHLKNFSGEVVKIVQNKSELAPDPKDKRFLDPAFRSNPFYRAGMQYYLAVRQGVGHWMDDLDFDDSERARASFVVKMIDFFPRDGGSGETVNLFSIRLDTTPSDAGPGPEHVLRVGLRRRGARAFSLFVMSQFNPGQTRVADSTTLLDVGEKYAIRLEVDTTTPQPGKPVATGYVNDARVVSLDSAGERVYGYVDTGRMYFPGAVSGAGFHLELDDLSVVGTR